jgi:Ni,Fe-hydrogenase III large subunit/NADH:ubiquinone oxidoreductase subunit C
MKTVDITEHISYLEKDELIMALDRLGNSSYVVCKSLTCIDLLNLDDIKERFTNVNARYLLLYSLYDLKGQTRKYVATGLVEGQTFHSFKKHWPNLSLMEQEIADLFHIKFYHGERIQKELVDFTNSAPLNRDNLHPDNTIRSIQKNVEENVENVSVNFADYDIFSQGGRLDFNYLGDEIQKITADPNHGLLLEKQLEQLPLAKIGSYLCHINPRHYIPYLLLWNDFEDYITNKKCSFYESLTRNMFLEIARVSENLDSLANMFHILKEEMIYRHFFALYKEVKMFLDKVSDDRPFSLVGSLSGKELDKEWIRDFISFMKGETKNLDDLIETVTKINTVYEQLKGRDKELNPIKYGVSGVTLASCGINHQQRSYEPFYVYHELDVETFLGHNNDSYDRLLIRLHDLRQSISNIIRITESFPVFEASTLENTEQHKNDRIIHSYTESVAGEIDYIVALSPDNVVERFHVITPTMNILPYFLESYEGSQIEKVMVDWMSIGLNLCEVRK